VLAVQASIYLPDGRPVRWVDNAFREDRYEYVAEMAWPAPLAVTRAAQHGSLPRAKRAAASRSR
jgi:hypothetical protein